MKGLDQDADVADAQMRFLLDCYVGGVLELDLKNWVAVRDANPLVLKPPVQVNPSAGVSRCTAGTAPLPVDSSYY